MQQELPQRHRLLRHHKTAWLRVDGRRAGEGAPWNPPTVADTKRKFYEAFRKPVPGIYNNIIQELLVQQHLMRWNKKYTYDEVRCGLVCVGLWLGSQWASACTVGCLCGGTRSTPATRCAMV